MGIAQVARGGIAGASWSARLVNAGASSSKIYHSSRKIAKGLTLYDAGSGGYHVGNGAIRVYNEDNWGYLEILGGGLSTIGSFESVRQLRKAPLGGAYDNVRARNEGGHVHHTPAQSASGLSRNEGPSIWMEVMDHTETASYKSNKGSRKYQAVQRKLINNDDFRAAVQMDVEDVISKFDSKYLQGLQEMQNYVNRLLQ